MSGEECSQSGEAALLVRMDSPEQVSQTPMCHTVPAVITPRKGRRGTSR